MAGDPVLEAVVTKLMRIAWRTVGSIITRVWAEVDVGGDRLAGLRRIGIDEIGCASGTAAAPTSGTFAGPHMGNQQLLVLVELDALHDCLLDPKKGAP